MGLAMIRLNRADRYAAPEPPKQITEEAAEWAGVEHRLPPGRTWGSATWLGHLCYGAPAGSLYLLTLYRLPLPHFLRGMLFALGVWAGSYLGWLPAVGTLPPATQQPARPNTIIIASHLLWGGLIGMLLEPRR